MPSSGQWTASEREARQRGRPTSGERDEPFATVLAVAELAGDAASADVDVKMLIKVRKA